MNLTKFVFGQIPFFAISKMAKNLFLNWENCQKCNFTKNIFDLFDFKSFFCLDFFKFSRPLYLNGTRMFVRHRVSWWWYRLIKNRWLYICRTVWCRLLTKKQACEKTFVCFFFYLLEPEVLPNLRKEAQNFFEKEEESHYHWERRLRKPLRYQPIKREKVVQLHLWTFFFIFEWNRYLLFIFSETLERLPIRFDFWSKRRFLVSK